MSNRFTPSLKQLREAAAKLPDPDKWPDEVYLIPVKSGSKNHHLEFRRVRASANDSRKERWLYEGKVLIRHRDIAEVLDENDPDSSAARKKRAQRVTLAADKAPAGKERSRSRSSRPEMELPERPRMVHSRSLQRP